MRTRLTFVAGLAVGYLLGAKAGRERYEQLVKLGRSVSGSPAVQQAGHAAAKAGRQAGGRVTEQLGRRMPERFSGGHGHHHHSHNGNGTHAGRGRHNSGGPHDGAL